MQGAYKALWSTPSSKAFSPVRTQRMDLRSHIAIGCCQCSRLVDLDDLLLSFLIHETLPLLAERLHAMMEQLFVDQQLLILYMLYMGKKIHD